MKPLAELLAACAALHHHLCPRQVLGVRLGMRAGEALGLDLPQTGKRLLTIAETDGCATDGVSVATNCWVGRRTLRIEDYGKVAATFVDTQTRRAVRLAPRPGIRDLAARFAPEARDHWEAMLYGYQRLTAEAMFSVQEVQLKTPLEWLMSYAGKQAVCARCGEEIMNEREVAREGLALCRGCAGPSYYCPADGDNE